MLSGNSRNVITKEEIFRFNSRQQFARLKDANSKLAKDISSELKHIQELKKPGDSKEQKRIDNIQDEFKNIMKDYNDLLAEACRKENVKIKRLSSRKKNKSSTKDNKRKLSVTEIRQQEEEERMLQIRQNNLKQLEADIEDLSDIFKVCR